MVEFIWPQGAELNPERAELLLDDPGYIAEDKISGERVTITIGVEGDVHLFSRSGSKADPSRPIELTHRWPRLVNQLVEAATNAEVLRGTILDGEGYSPSIREAEIPGFLNSKADSELPEHFIYIVWDVVWLHGKYIGDLPLAERLKYLEIFVTTMSAMYYDSSIVTKVLSTKPGEDKRKFVNSILASGGEGAILKKLSSPYYEDKRPAGVWTKYKKHDTFDCIILGYIPGKGKYTNKVGALKLGQYSGDSEQPIEVCTAAGFSDKIRDEISSSPESYIGTVVEVDCYERSVYGNLVQPRIKRFRVEGEKSPKDCRF